MNRTRNRSSVYRHYFTQAHSRSSAGAGVLEEVFTATRPIRIVGWKIAASITQMGLTAVLGGVTIVGEVTRATALATDFALDIARCSFVDTSDVAGTEGTGGGGNTEAILERYLTDKEADDLGLLLDYGESIRFISAMTQAVAGVSAGVVMGIWFYEEVGG